MIFPLKEYQYTLPVAGIDPGGFSTKRKYDIHTGVDLYCEDGQEVFSMADGEVVAIENFTGQNAGSPWWEDTQAVVVYTNGVGYILYGEITTNLKPGQQIKQGELIGLVKKVLKKDKGITPTSMLHMELYSQYNGSVIWYHNEQKPEGLQDITQLLKNIL